MRYLIGVAIGSAVLLLAAWAAGASAQETAALEQKSAEDAQEKPELEQENVEDARARLVREMRETVAALRSARQQESPGEYVCPEHPDIRATWQATCPECGAQLQALDQESAGRLLGDGFAPPMARIAQALGQSAEDLRETMEPFMERMQVMMNVPLAMYDPGMLLAQRGQLGLTEEQAAKLEAVAEAARERAKGVLTDAQKEALAAFDESPKTMRDMLAEVMRPMLGRMLEELRESKKLKELQESKESEESKDPRALPDE